LQIPQINASGQHVSNVTTNQVVLISPPPNIPKEPTLPAKEAKPRVQDLLKELDPDGYLGQGVSSKNTYFLIV